VYYNARADGSGNGRLPVDCTHIISLDHSLYDVQKLRD
jgi:hypothetical protein